MLDRIDFPPTTDPMALLTALVIDLRESYDAEVMSYDSPEPGEVRVDLRLRVRSAEPNGGIARGCS